MNNHIQKAVEVIKKGGIVIFPTDTAFGIGCRIDDEKAVQKLFKIRKRPVEKATPVLVDTVKMAQDYLEPVPKEVIDKLIEPYWPGALTIVLPCAVDKVPELVRGGNDTLGVRIPNHKTARAIIKGLGKPILGPSANFAGEKTPYAMQDLDPKLIKLVDYVVPGTCTLKQASTLVDCSVKPWKVLREGAIKIRNYESGIRNNGEKEIKLFIGTSSNQEITVSLDIDGEKDMIKQKIGKQKAQVVLPLIDQLLKKHKLSVYDITHIEVATGPGSFTGLRVGLSIANALSFALNIPINNQKPGTIVDATYE